jgi:glycosyltransferase involved in cell wall biosynthesis
MHVLVLLSTFNGAEFLGAQVQSILEQAFESTLGVLVRDDGSTDGTLAILEELADPRVEIVRGSNIGAKASYLALIEEARNRNPDYVAFADQDDVWLPGKLERALTLLKDKATPTLYCSALDLVDSELRPRGRFAYAGRPQFEHAFFTNCVTGCTCVINRALLGLLKQLPRPGAILMHDWWLYLVAVAFGTVVYDPQSHILYRQHAANQIGRGQGLFASFERWRKFMRRPPEPNRLTQAREFDRLHGSALNDAQRAFLRALLACEDRPIARARLALAQVRGHPGFDELAGLTGFVFGG